MSVDVVTLGDGSNVWGRAPDAPGYDLLGTFVGSEGTLGIATSVTVRLVRLPEEVRTVLVGFVDVDAAGAATSAIIGAGIVPAAIEMMDALAIVAAEAAVQCDYPRDAGAVLVIELDGPAVEVAQELGSAGALPGARSIRVQDCQRMKSGRRCGRAENQRSRPLAGSARTT